MIMLEDIALSISTLVFLLCNLVVNSIAPAVPAETAEPSESIEYSETVSIAVAADSVEEFVLTGEWNSCGRIFEFTSSGKLLYNDHAMPYEIRGNTMTITSEVGGSKRIYTLAYEPINDRVIRLNGITLYKTSR